MLNLTKCNINIIFIELYLIINVGIDVAEKIREH